MEEGSQARYYVALAYPQLRRMAAAYLAREPAGATLQPTALVHEAFLKLVKSGKLQFTDRNHFLAVAARAMREILVDRGRANRTAKRDPAGLVPLPSCQPDYAQIAIVDRALSKLAALDARQAQIVEMRFFGGMTMEEVADHLGLSVRTIKREWSTARLWLEREVNEANS